METLKVYLSGAMCSVSFEEQSEWQKHIIDKITIEHYFNEKKPVFFNPVNYYNFTEKRQRTEREVMQFDLNAVRHSDLIIVNFNDPSSLGTCAELAIAYELKIPIVGINDGNKELHPWLECFCDRMCSNVEEAIEYVIDFYLN